MKIISTAYSSKHSLRALRRIHKMIICGSMSWAELHKMYRAMLHLERYMERLTLQNRPLSKKASRKSK
ncbi:hypothetical protein [Acinetobacter pseudolwoffii]|uniref:Uncharacterized protein n=1 Tax=Acinetobacter pseudolwoffii TaxID=2053287 RepID=A0A2H9UP61_9GAMM|nr:hypothetical protein [Acinetobacter pseudolwoffii]PJI33492.1 hypothetical protein CU320_03585 [Acinetobacter pseudolwoffii]